MGFHHVVQAGLKLLTSGDRPALASAGMSHCAQPKNIIYILMVPTSISFITLKHTGTLCGCPSSVPCSGLLGCCVHLAQQAVLGARFTLLAQILCPNVAPCSACRWTGHAATGFHVGPWYLDEGDVVGPKYLETPATVEPQKVEAEFHYVGQTGLELLTSSDLPISASQSAGITDVSHQHAGQYIYITILFENYVTPH
ncbi:Protein GVQW1 [Plecturocebus cupreus]